METICNNVKPYNRENKIFQNVIFWHCYKNSVAKHY